MKRILYIIILIYALAALYSCGESGDEAAKNPPDSDISGTAPEEGVGAVFSEGDYVMIASANAIDKELSYALFDVLDPMLGENGQAYIGSQYSESTEREILLGIVDSERPATLRAKQIVDSMPKKSRYELNYAIYAEGGCIAIYYESCDIATVSAAAEPILWLVSHLLKSGLPNFPVGEVTRGVTDIYSLQSLADESMLKGRWSALEEELGTDTTEAIKKLYSLYSDNIPDWLATLYAKGFFNAEDGMYLGGFYESTSGKDNLGFGPDVEATMQALRFIEQSGMIDHLGGIEEAIPEWMQAELVYFAKSLQAENGYFYHPQWSVDATNKNLGRRGRDLGWAVSIMQAFGAKPTYNTPSGVKGDGLSADDYLHTLGIEPPKSPFDNIKLTTSLGGNNFPAIFGSASAFSTVEFSGVTLPQASLAAKLLSAPGSGAKAATVALASSDDNTDFLSSFELFIDYIESKDVDSEPYHSTFNSTAQQIKAASAKMGIYAPGAEITDEKYLAYSGLTMCEMLIKYLDAHINEKTGIWGKDWEDYNAALDAAEDTATPRMTGTEFKYTNGLHGHIAIYNSWKIPYPEPALAAKSVLKGLLSDEPSETNICSLYNLWFCIDSLCKNVRSYHSQEVESEVLSAISDALSRDGAAAVLNTYEKLKKYQKPDGGFAHNIHTGSAKNQGMPTGLGLNESNLDAVCIGTTGMIRTLFDSFGAERIPIYTPSDFMRFIEIIDSGTPVMKAPYTSSIIDFEDGSIPYLIEAEGGAKVEDGDLISDGTIKVFPSPLSDIGRTLAFVGTLVASEGRYTVEICGKEGAFIAFEAELLSGKLKLYDNAGNLAAEAECEVGKSFELSIEIIISDGAPVCYVSFGGAAAAFSSKLEASLDDIEYILLDNAGGVLRISELCFAKTESSEHKFDVFPETLIKYINGDNVNENTLECERLEGEGVLHYHREINYDGSQSYFDLTATALSKSPSTTVFKTKMLVASVASASPIEFVLMPAGAAKAQRVFKLTLSASKTEAGSPIYVYDSPGGIQNSSGRKETSAKIGEWFELKIEYTEPNEGEGGLIRAYIDGALVWQTSEMYGTAQLADITDTVRFAPHTPFLGDIYFDNMSYVQR